MFYVFLLMLILSHLYTDPNVQPTTQKPSSDTEIVTTEGISTSTGSHGLGLLTVQSVYPIITAVVLAAALLNY